MKLTKQQEAEIIQAYYSFWIANLSANMELFGSYLLDDFSIIGSAVGENFFNKQDAIAFYTATAEQLKDKAQLRNRKCSIQAIRDNCVIVLELSDLYVLIGEEWTFYGHARISCVMEKISDEWKAVHQHASFPDHRTEEGQQLATKKIEKENLELREAVQRRTVELEAKNRELEIEAAVERVRAQSMAMQQTTDIAKVNEEIFSQISKLNIDGFTGVAIYLVEDDEMVTVWDLSSPGSMGNVNGYAFRYDPQKTPTLSEFVPIWLAGQQDYFIMDFPKERLQLAASELEPFYPAMAESFRAAIASGVLEHQWNATATISHGILSLDMMKPPTEEVKFITLKMAAAFNLAHQRFYDLQKAEGQTREAQIEMALEKVRSRTMAMQRSDELADASFVLDTQVRSLGIQTWGCAFNIYGDNGSTEWFSSEGGTLPPYQTPREDFFLRAYEAGQRNEPLYIEEFVGENCKAHYEYLCTIPVMGDALRGMIEAGFKFPERQIDHATFFKYGYLLFITLQPVPDAHEVFIRFAKVFEQTYTRFLDLQKAEEQSREAEIELALERVRAKTMSMQHSDELLDSATLLFDQLRSLGVPTWNCSFNIWSEDKKYAVAWNATKDGFGRPFHSPSHEDVFLRFYQAQERNEEFYVEEMGGEVLEQHYEYLATLPGVSETLAELKAAGIALPSFQVFHIAHFAQGYLMFITYEQVPEFWSIFKRFARVFEQTYTRFLDLQKAEAQTLRAEQDLEEIKEARKKAEAALSELQAAQKQLIQSEKMASLGELTAGIAHEIQNPLNFVNNFSEVSKELLDEMKAAMDSGDAEEANAIAGDLIQNLEKINHHGKRADAIVKGMLQHSRTSSSQKEPTDIHLLADEYLRLAYHGLRAKDKSFNAALETDFDASIGKIEIIPQDIGRVLLNLINNAFYAVSERKKIEGEGFKPVVAVETKKVSNAIEISISDNGNGIPQNIIDKIFQPFFTTKPTGQGTGLGLSLSYDIVKAHGGELKVETRQGEGTTFFISLLLVN